MRTTLCLLAVLLGATTRPSTVRAQEPVRDTLAERPQALAPITVTGARRAGYRVTSSRSATKTMTPLREVPQAISVVTRALITDQAMQGMADAVRYIPGITMGQGEGNRDQPTVRGIGTTAAFFVDGMRDDAQYFRDLYNVERVESLKGANALIFGRGAGGGVLNRVTKTASRTSQRELTASAGAFGQRRAAVDVGSAAGSRLALRLNGVYENSDFFRNGVSLERYGVTPALTLDLGRNTRVNANYEHFYDQRTADRGVPSFAGEPVASNRRTFFGDPAASRSTATVDAAGVAVEHTTAGGLVLRNHSRFTNYDKAYQNVFPGAVNAAGTQVMLSAYNSRNDRRNLFNQSEASYRLATGAITHTLLVGVELGRQDSDNFRATGYFNDSSTAFLAPLKSPTVSVPLTVRQSSTDADNRVVATMASLYFQDQLTVASRLHLVAGLRYEQFHLAYHNNRTGQELARRDRMVAPRLGLVVTPVGKLSVYGSYSVAYLPSSGDQFASLSATTETLEPEKFANLEIGAKWDVTDELSLTAAGYRLDRTNTAAPDPNDPARTVQTGSQRTRGIELELSGRISSTWSVAGGLARQDARVTSPTATAKIGARVALVPRTTLSLWNRLQLWPQWGVGMGLIHQDRSFAAIDNAVSLAAFTRFDAAVYLGLGRGLRAQLNVENLLDANYFASAHNNNNISPGSPRAARVTVTTTF